MNNPSNNYTKEDHKTFMEQLTKSYPEQDKELRSMTLKWSEHVVKTMTNN